jgi:N6-L-threonylcarbamoyladenine synthase
MIILGIETTCDETGISLIECENNRLKILKNELASQYKVHNKFGGVVPILAAREHTKNLPILLKKINQDFNLEKIDYLAFSVGPGLLPALIAGKEFVIKLAEKLNKKIIPVDHLSAHWYSVLIKNKSGWQKIKQIDFPALILIVSGGHTNLYLFENWGKRKKLGQTLDDAAGESLDKAARILNLGYPGGPQIEKMSKLAKKYYMLPKPILNKGYNFSFSGLKTAFSELVKEIKKYQKLNQQTVADLSFSFQKTVFEILIYKIKKAVSEFSPKTIIVAGGVSANQTLKKMIKNVLPNFKIYFPEKTLATDNGVNIALAGYLLVKNKRKVIGASKLDVYQRLP